MTRKDIQFIAICVGAAAFIALALKYQIPTLSSSIIKLLSLAAVAIVFIQSFFLYKVKRANDVDKEKAFHFEDKLNEATGGAENCNFKGTRVAPVLKKATYKGCGKYWSVLSQVSITVVLLLCAACVILRNVDKDNTNEQTKTVKLNCTISETAH